MASATFPSIGGFMFRSLARSVLAALPAAALSVCALAQTADPGHPSFYQLMLQKMDTNQDGRISLDEYVAAASARFKSIDTQNKGAVDAADIAASPVALQRDEKIATAIVKHMDTGRQGLHLAGRRRRFRASPLRPHGQERRRQAHARRTHRARPSRSRQASPAPMRRVESAMATEARGVQAEVFRPHRRQS